jgi:hypothetical protein
MAGPLGRSERTACERAINRNLQEADDAGRWIIAWPPSAWRLFPLDIFAAPVLHAALHRLACAVFPNDFNGLDPSRPRFAASPSTAALVFSLIFTSAAAAFAAAQRCVDRSNPCPGPNDGCRARAACIAFFRGISNDLQAPRLFPCVVFARE